ncbi:MAG: LOG family protein [Acidimicrobiales bacterium]
MHERKQLMFDLADAFVALRGALGTLEELAEITTWAQLGIHAKPIVVLDEAGYWTGLRVFLDGAVDGRFLLAASRDRVRWVGRVGDVLGAVGSYRAPPAEGGLMAGET